MLDLTSIKGYDKNIFFSKGVYMNIIITGASRGIGKAIALELAGKNNNLLINCVSNVDKLSEVHNELNRLGCNNEMFAGDVSDYDICRKMTDTAIQKFGSIDVLINNAGISYIGLLQDMNINEWNRIWNTNVTSVFNCCNNVLPHMISAKSGKIINISSVWGNAGASCEVAYSATKGAVNSFTKALAKEVAPSNIQVNAIACGAIDTEMNNHLSIEDKISLAEEIPAGRFGQPSEIGRLVSSIISAPSYMTGQIITADGGWL